jgi:alpha-galactosidase
MGAEARPRIFGSVDRFVFPGRIQGWAVKRQDGALAADLHITLCRGETELAATRPDQARPDVAGDPSYLAGFVLDGEGLATAEELLAGEVTIQAVDGAGARLVLPIWEVTRKAMEEALALQALRELDAATALDILKALGGNKNLPAATVAALAEGVAAIEAPGKTRRPSHAGVRAKKIAFIGAGSTVFAKNLLGDILLHPALAESRICLHDVDAERLRVSGVVAGRIAQTLGAKAAVEVSEDLGEALDGADYVFNMIQVGGYRPCTLTDFEVPKRFGLRQTIADTLGVGGIMRGLRTIPVLAGMAREMERRCPGALHLNYVNPMAINCWALAEASPIRTVGLCHSVPHTAGELAHDLGLAPDRIEYQVAGINHMAFYLSLTADGEDLYPRLHRLLEEGRVPPHNRVRYEVMRRFGYFVTESSEHFAEYVPWFIKRDRPDLVERYNIPLDEYPRRCELQIAEWDRLSAQLTNPAVPLEVSPSLEYGARIINAIETGEPAVIYGNVRNNNLIPNLPRECCVEVPCLVDANGVQPVQIGALPPQLAALMQTNINVQSLTVEAARTGLRDHVYHAAMLDPHTAAELSLDEIADLVDALIDAHGEWIPGHGFAA